MAGENEGSLSPLLPRDRQVARPQKMQDCYFYKENPFAFIFKKFKTDEATELFNLPCSH